MDNNLLKRLQKRLSDKGIKLGLPKLREHLASLNIEELTEDNLEPLTEQLVNAFGSQLAPIPTKEEEVETPKLATLTNIEKETIVKSHAEDFGITLTDVEVLEIVSSEDSLTSDTIGFLTFVRDTLRQKREHRKLDRETLQSLVQEIGQMVEDDKETTKTVIAGVNRDLKGIVDQCKSQSDNYVNPYADRLESMRKALQERYPKAV